MAVVFSLLAGWKGKRCTKKFDEGGFARITGAHDKYTLLRSALTLFHARAHLLEWSRILSSPHSSWAIDGAHSTTGITVATAIGHALGARIWVDVRSLL